MKLLVVDDDDGDIRIVSLALKQAGSGYVLDTAGSLAEAIVRVEHGDIELVLLDLGLPDSVGLETVERMCRACPQIPIVVLTGLSSEEAGLQAIRCGATDYLVKDDIDVGTLGRTIRYASERKRLELELVHMATHDALTGVLNRRTFEGAVARAVAKAQRGKHSALLVLDVDRFKLVNDTLGHTAGDDVLVSIAKCIGLELREADTLARVGGDEFIALLEDVPMDQAQQIADRIRAAVIGWVAQADLGVCPTLSIGLAEIDGRHDYRALVSQADRCLYEAKERGRDRVVVAA